MKEKYEDFLLDVMLICPQAIGAFIGFLGVFLLGYNCYDFGLIWLGAIICIAHWGIIILVVLIVKILEKRNRGDAK